MFKDAETGREATPEEIEDYINDVYLANKQNIDSVVRDVDHIFEEGLEDSLADFEALVAKYGRERAYGVMYDSQLRDSDFDDDNIVSPRAAGIACSVIGLMVEVIKLRAQLAAHHAHDAGLVLNDTLDGGYGASFKDPA